MAKVSPIHIASWVSVEIEITEFVPLHQVMEQSLSIHLAGKSQEEIAEIIEDLQVETYNQLCEIQLETQKLGMESTFDLDNTTGDYFIKVANSQIISMLSKLDALTSDQFEDFCVYILSSLGAEATRVGGKNDNGVDFVGFNIPIGNTSSLALSRCSPIVIGQAKKYKDRNLVSIHELRSFLGAGLVQADEIKRGRAKYGIFSPVTFAFWTTSNFFEDAKEFAMKSGLWCLNGIALSQLALKLQILV